MDQRFGRILLGLWLVATPVGAGAGATSDCTRFSDTFETLDVTKWQEVLVYSAAQGQVSVQRERLRLAAPSNQETEIQVYALFVFTGDFDIQADYDLENARLAPDCRLNAGMVLQTQGDALSYKCYVGLRPGEEALFRGRVDWDGERNQELHKVKGAPAQGTLRIVRQKGSIRFLALKNNKWMTVCQFRLPCVDPIRLRFKLQMERETQATHPCPTAAVAFDNFKVNACGGGIVPD